MFVSKARSTVTIHDILGLLDPQQAEARSP